MRVIATSPVALIEPVLIEDDFCSGLARIEDVAGCARFILYSQQTLFEAGEQVVYVVKRKIVLPIGAIMPGIEMTTAYLARRAISIAGDRLLRMVRD